MLFNECRASPPKRRETALLQCQAGGDSRLPWESPPVPFANDLKEHALMIDPERRQEQALGHPVRRRIVEASSRNPTRPLAAAALFPELSDDPGLADQIKGKLALSQVAYHLRVLQRAGVV